MILSILIPTVGIRSVSLHKTLLRESNKVIRGGFFDDVEFIINLDNFEKTIGKKLNEMAVAASGTYLVCFGDDDEFSDDFFDVIIPELKKNIYDCICYNVGYYVNGVKQKKQIISTKFRNWGENNEFSFRHFSTGVPVKKDIVDQVRFGELPLPFDEGLDFANRIIESDLCKNEKYIDADMYIYRFSSDTTLCRPGIDVLHNRDNQEKEDNIINTNIDKRIKIRSI